MIRTAKRLKGKTNIYIVTNETKGKSSEGVKVETSAWLTDNVYQYGNFVGKVQYKDDGSVERLTFIQQVQ